MTKNQINIKYLFFMSEYFKYHPFIMGAFVYASDIKKVLFF